MIEFFELPTIICYADEFTIGRLIAVRATTSYSPSPTGFTVGITSEFRQIPVNSANNATDETE